jgi:hypothetical protein
MNHTSDRKNQLIFFASTGNKKKNKIKNKRIKREVGTSMAASAGRSGARLKRE